MKLIPYFPKFWADKLRSFPVAKLQAELVRFYANLRETTSGSVLQNLLAASPCRRFIRKRLKLAATGVSYTSLEY